MWTCLFFCVRAHSCLVHEYSFATLSMHYHWFVNGVSSVMSRSFICIDGVFGWHLYLCTDNTFTLVNYLDEVYTYVQHNSYQRPLWLCANFWLASDPDRIQWSKQALSQGVWQKLNSRMMSRLPVFSTCSSESLVSFSIVMASCFIL